ncbi:MAG: methionyl-tRNA formyltransferase [Halanaerobiales bacterium]
MNIVFAGTPDFSVPSLKKLSDEDEIKIKGVITQPDRRRGRGKKVQYTPVKKESLKRNLQVLQPENINSDEIIKKLDKMELDLIVVVAYGQILSKELLELPEKGCINLHASLLPEYRGSSPIQHAILDGKDKTGVTTMFMEEGLDTGDIIYQKEIAIKNSYNAGDLHDKLAQSGAELLTKTVLDLKDNDLPTVPQDETKSSYTSQLSKEDGLIDWGKSSRYIYYLVKAMNPWPGSFTYLNGELLKIFEVEVLNHNTELKPGSVVNADPDFGLLVQTGDGVIKINRLQLAGKKEMSSSDFLRGYDLEEGIQLDSKRE